MPTLTKKPFHSFVFNGRDNGGEAFSVMTQVELKDEQRFATQTFMLNSYCNSSSFVLKGEVVSPDAFRALANALDKKWIEITASPKEGKTDQIIGSFSYNLPLLDEEHSPLRLDTVYFDNGDGVPEGVFTNQHLILQAYGHEARINLCGASVSPDSLRELANQLDKFYISLS